MSIKLMSAIFETEFRDLPLPPIPDEVKQRMAKASSLKLVLLAIADHANDEGESAYPGLTRLERKTGMSRQGVVDVISALKYNGLLSVSEIPSRLGTNNYTLNLGCFPCLTDASKDALLVKPLDYPSQATLLEVVKPLDLNHSLSIIKTSSAPSKEKVKLPENTPLDWMVQAGVSSEVIEAHSRKENAEREKASFFEQKMGLNPLKWWHDDKLKALLKFLMSKSPEEIEIFAAWSKSEFSPLSPTKARQHPDYVIDCWLQAFEPKIKTKPRPKPVSAEA